MNSAIQLRRRLLRLQHIVTGRLAVRKKIIQALLQIKRTKKEEEELKCFILDTFTPRADMHSQDRPRVGDWPFVLPLRGGLGREAGDGTWIPFCCSCGQDG